MVDSVVAGAERADRLQLLRHGTLSLQGRLTTASNATFLCTVSGAGLEASCVYKPVAGERPLRDFPHGTLAHREVASYLLSDAAGFGVVPPSVLRDGPFGPGMCQQWIEVDPARELVDVVAVGRAPAGWRTVLQAYDGAGDPVLLVHADDARLRLLAAFDAVVNNADRKGGHLLVTSAGELFGVDHGLTFNVEPKLRTVLWGWAGEPFDGACRAALDRLTAALAADLATRLGTLLAAPEVAALRRRLRHLRRTGRFPSPGDGWPSVPWPVF